MFDLEEIQRAEGIFFYPQLLILFSALAACLYTWDTLRSGNVVPKRFRQFVSGLSSSGLDLESVRVQSDLEEVLERTLRESRRSGRAEKLPELVAMALDEVRVSMERRLGYLNIIAQISMLVGLLGTVWGLVGSFSVISASNVAPQPSELASGVSQALMTTIIGLLVSIPTLFWFTHCQGLANRRFLELRYHAFALMPVLQGLLKESPILNAVGSNGASPAHSQEQQSVATPLKTSPQTRPPETIHESTS